MRLIKVNGLKRRKTISVVLLMMYAGGESEPQTVQVLDTCVFFPIPALLFSRRSVCSHHLFVYSDLLSVFSSFFFFFISALQRAPPLRYANTRPAFVSGKQQPWSRVLFPLFFFCCCCFVGTNNWWSGVVTRPREKSSQTRCCLSSVWMKQTVKRLNPRFTDYLLAAFHSNPRALSCRLPTGNPFGLVPL